jgi:CubicO group peptidase (beta-lactamase class C family)
MYSKYFLHAIFLLSVYLLFNGCEKDVIQHDIDIEIQQLMQEKGLPSLAACVIKNGEIVWSEFDGYSDGGKQKEVTNETIYHIGSISKLFIVTAIMQLESQGLIDIDNDINQYLPIDLRHPDFPDIPITTRMLLTHTAGLAWPKSYNGQRGMWNSFEPDMAPPPMVWVPEFLTVNGIHYDAQLWKPINPGGYEFYSNIGPCVIAYLIEEISGLNFREYCMEHIFIPLNMQNTSYNYADLNLDQIAVLYQSENNYRKDFDNRLYPSSGLKTTIEDLSHFVIAYMNGGSFNGTHILDKIIIDRILEIQNEASGRCLIWQAYSGGWFGHTGGLEMGTATTLEMHPESKTAFIIFTNKHDKVVHPGNEIYGLAKQKANAYRE